MIQKKICLLGSFSVGKTSLIRRYVSSLYTDKYLTTAGVKIDKKIIKINGQEVCLIIWDIAGEDDFSSLRTTYLRGMAGYIIVIDGTRLPSYHVGLSVLSRVQDLLGELPVVFAINKTDLVDEWQLEKHHLEYLTQLGYPVIRTSAKLDSGVEELFTGLACQLV